MRTAKRAEDAESLDLVPIMNLVTILIPFLLMGAQFVSLAVIESTLPALSAPEPEELDEDRFSLTVGVTPEGFVVTNGGKVLSMGSADGPTVPCRQAGCPTPDSYDGPGLTRVLADVKDRFPEEDHVVLVPSASIPFEVLVGVMDAVRDDPGTKVDGKPRPLFPDIVIAGGAP